MSAWLRKYASLLCVLLFLSPGATEIWHAYQHQDDVHCFEKNAKHIHTEEHHCAICDFTFSIADTPAGSTGLLLSTFYTVAKAPLYYRSNSYNTAKGYFLRGPPALS